jgi:hypothetical protein
VRARVWRLAPLQIAHTLADGFAYTGTDLRAFPADTEDPQTGFVGAAAASFPGEQFTTTLFGLAEAVAGRVGASLGKDFACMGATTVADACLANFAATMGRKAFRRPLSPEDAAFWAGRYREAQKTLDGRGAAEALVQAMILSPAFVYRTELGDPARPGALDGWEIASALSYGLTDGPPPADLAALAERGALADPARRREAAAALMRTPRAGDKLAGFVRALLELEHLEDAPGLSKSLAAELAGEAPGFVKAVLAGPDPTLTALYTAPFTVVGRAAGALYGLGSTAPATPGRLELDPQKRFGLFTQAGWLTARPDAIRRGKILRKAVMCQVLPEPPPNAGSLNTMLPSTPPEWTEAEKYQVFLRERAACAACHALFQPFGLAFEVFDRSGVYRERNQAGRPIDPAGEVAGVPGVGPFAGPRALVDQLLAGGIGASCFSAKLATYVLGQALGADPLGSCVIREVARGFRAAGLRLPDLAAELAAQPIFVTRAP